MQEFWAKTLLTISALLLLTTGIYLYTSGYRISKGTNTPIDLTRTGMIGVKSLPPGASVYINDVLKTATNDNVRGLNPGKYNLRIVKSGFVKWEREVEVFAELVTDVTAVLISQTPRLEPLTNTGARAPVISPSLNYLAYFSEDERNPGIGIIPMSTTGLNLFRAEPFLAFQDTLTTQLSTGTTITWSPDETQLLIKTPDEEEYYLVTIRDKKATLVRDIEELQTNWDKLLQDKRADFMQKIDINEQMRALAIKPSTIWSPDDKKFLYTIEKESKIEFKVFNMEKPLPVGEKTDYTVFSIQKDQEDAFNVFWYADSYHLIVVEGYSEETQRGKIYLTRVDGTNKTEIYNNTMYSNKAYSSPNGDKIIYLTTFKSDNQTDLYTISIR